MITSEELGRRLRIARNNVGISQDEAARALDVPRPAISQIESGKRGVGGLELARLAELYRRPLASFFDGDAADSIEDPVTVLFRASELDDRDREVVGEFELLCRNYRELEDLVELEREISVPDYGDMEEPRNRWEAIHQGELVASAERGRMGIGDDPIRDVPELLDSQGIRVFVRSLHQGGISGLFLYDRSIGPCILINAAEHPRRLPFNASHEFGHVLLDRRLRGRVSAASRALSSAEQQEELLEVRANSFAAAFLMPADGIERFLWDRGKTRRNQHPVGVIDVLLLQRAFGVSYKSALYRLQNLKWLSRDQREELEAHRPDVLARQLGLDEERGEPRQWLGGVEDYPLGYIYLVLHAYQHGRLSVGRVAELLGTSVEGARDLIWDLEPVDEDPEDIERLAGSSRA